MIYLGHDTIRISQIAEDWYLRLRDFLTGEGVYYVSRTGQEADDEGARERCNTYKAKMLAKVKWSGLEAYEISLCEEAINTYFSRLKEYVLADEERLLAKHLEYEAAFIKSETPETKNAHALLAKIYEDLYDDFTKEYAYYFFRELNIRTCPYCNRNYTFTVKDEDKKTRPEYDHFYNKSSNPLLAVSFYNLVPSCHTCNHIKGTDSLGINPYFHGFKGEFKIAPDGAFLGYEPESEDEKNDMRKLALNGLYMEHDDYVQEIFAKAQAYNEHAREALVDSFQGAGESPAEVYDFVWGKNLENARQINRPLSKLTRDILKQVGVSLPEFENQEERDE